MRTVLFSLMSGLVCLAGGTIAAEQKKGEDPTPRRDAILKLFLAEFVPITHSGPSR